MNRILGIVLYFFATFNAAIAGYHCNTPDDCIVFCNNIENSKIRLLKNTDWIPVPLDTGDCYFHNTKTREDTSIFPVIEIN